MRKTVFFSVKFVCFAAFTISQSRSQCVSVCVNCAYCLEIYKKNSLMKLGGDTSCVFLMLMQSTPSPRSHPLSASAIFMLWKIRVKKIRRWCLKIGLLVISGPKINTNIPLPKVCVWNIINNIVNQLIVLRRHANFTRRTKVRFTHKKKKNVRTGDIARFFKCSRHTRVKWIHVYFREKSMFSNRSRIGRVGCQVINCRGFRSECRLRSIVRNPYRQNRVKRSKMISFHTTIHQLNSKFFFSKYIAGVCCIIKLKKNT